MTRLNHPYAFFFATNQINAYQLWATDGTAAGTFMLTDYNPSGGGISATKAPLVINGHLLFTAGSPDLWTSDGTAAGTFDLGVHDQEQIVFNGELYFTDNQQLWRSDGTASGTVQVTNVQPNDLVVANGALYFFAPTNDGIQLWKSDGSAAGTVQVTDVLNPHSNGLNAFGLTAVGGELFFLANDGTHGWQGVGIGWHFHGNVHCDELCRCIE
jgi:ELWxxDGT repeat protein